MTPNLTYAEDDVKATSAQAGRVLHLHYSYVVLTAQLLVPLQNPHDQLLFPIGELWQIRGRARQRRKTSPTMGPRCGHLTHPYK